MSKYINDRSFNSPNTFFAREFEPLENALQSPLYRLNLENTQAGGADIMPPWFTPRVNVLNALSRIEQQNNTYEGGFVETPSGAIRSNQLTQPHQGNVKFTTDERNALVSLINQVASTTPVR